MQFDKHFVDSSLRLLLYYEISRGESIKKA